LVWKIPFPRQCLGDKWEQKRVRGDFNE
jgi:hypothetical protein